MPGTRFDLIGISIEVSQFEKVNRTETSYLSIYNIITRLISPILRISSTFAIISNTSPVKLKKDFCQLSAHHFHVHNYINFPSKEGTHNQHDL